LFQPEDVVKYPGTPSSVDAIVEVQRKDPKKPMFLTLEVHACFEIGKPIFKVFFFIQVKEFIMLFSYR
jgi:hypothetical protein